MIFFAPWLSTFFPEKGGGGLIREEGLFDREGLKQDLRYLYYKQGLTFTEGCH